MRNLRAKPGVTLVELLLVLAILIILAAVTIPSFAALQGNAKQRAAVDTVRARIADARALAMSEGVPYRLAIHQDGTRVRLAPDDDNFATAVATAEPNGSAKAIETPLEQATAQGVPDPNAAPATGDGSGWVTIATFLPNGTCKEDKVYVDISEDGFPPVRIYLRGITGSSRVLPPDSKSGGQRP